MTSLKISHVLPIEIKHICSSENHLAVVGDDALLIYDRNTNSIPWRLNLPSQGPYDNREVLTAQDLFIASFLADQEEDLAWIFAIVPQSGDVAWKIPVPHRCLMGRNRTDNYIVSTQDSIFYSERQGGKSWLRDAKTGVSKTELRGFNIDVMDSNASHITLFEWHSGELLLMDASAEAPEFTPHTMGKWLKDFKMTETQVTALVIDEEGENRQQKLKQYLLPSMELQFEFVFPEALEDAKLLDVASASHILLEDGDSVHCIDLTKGESRWTLESDMPTLMRTSQGLIVFPSFGAPEIRDFDTGEVVLELPDDGFQPPFLQGEGEVLCLGSWDEIESLQNPDVSERTVWLEWLDEQPAIDEPEPLVEYSVLKKLGSEGPVKDTLKQNFQAAVTSVQENGDWESFFGVMASVFEVDSIHAEVQDFLKMLKAAGTISGAIGISSFERVMTAFTYNQLWSVGPDNALFPALLIASESGGHYYYVHLETSALICVHHDDNYDFACNWESLLEKGEVQDFAKAMFSNSLFTLKAWLGFDAGFGELDQDELRDLEEEEPKEFYLLLQKATGWSFAKLYEKMWDNELSVLTYGDDNYDVLKELAEG